ncbi:MAG TPA: ATP-binding protein [Planctomycetota bacterium]|nr:ATP-binding protein [Planctomycetota bacterium]HRR81139.1 ATP-binding protein [Planctomycetota bacterium]HRT94701.1 ATP-binding protein [Planctomycetota bacterium]
MGRRPLLWQLFPSYVVIIALSLAAVTWYATSTLRDFHHAEVARELEARARVIERQAEKLLAPEAAAALDALCKDLGKRSATRITVMLPSGRVIGDSDEDPTRMENHATPSRPEMMAALRGETGTSVRHSATLDRNMMYLALPLVKDGAVAGVLRTSLPLTAIEEAMNGVHRRLAVAGLAVGLVAAVFSLWISRRVSQPLAAMRQGAERFARGELDTRVAVPDTEELAALAEALNQMAAQLGERLNRILCQRNEQEAILASMVEGVLAVDTQERLISLNRAAIRMLGVDLAAPEGRSLEEVVRNSALQGFASRALAAPGPTEGEVTLRDNGEVTLQLCGAPLRDAAGRQIGAVIVLNDVTRLRRLEGVRRDFVANVSHELKTPITSIKGFVETLLAGALREPADAERFLSIIAKQADRLNAIIEDLLLLSRLEEGNGKPSITLEDCKLREVLAAAVQVCCLQAEEKGIAVHLTCDEGLTARVNPPLLEQAIVNLVGNAIKFSEPGQPVEVKAEQTSAETLLTVADHGCGIERQHLPRLFERFYRVDKARSRKLGGTGLGLAIVKHIAQAHGGSVTVESAPGKGSTFTLRLPR